MPLSPSRSCRAVPGFPDSLRCPGPGRAPANVLRLSPRLRHAGTELRLLNTLTTFGAPRDVTLAELVLEAFYPADPAADALRALRAAGVS